MATVASAKVKELSKGYAQRIADANVHYKGVVSDSFALTAFENLMKDDCYLCAVIDEISGAQVGDLAVYNGSEWEILPSDGSGSSAGGVTKSYVDAADNLIKAC